MSTLTLPSRVLPLAAIVVALALGACSKDASQNGLDGSLNGANSAYGSGPATPGSVAEFQSASVGDRVWFDLNSSDINATGQATLNKQAQWLKQYSQYRATIEGHADERGTEEYNFGLGARRAQSVQSYLIAHGISASRMKTISYGKTRPVVQCNEGDDSCQSQNRRAVTVLAQ